MSNSEYLTGTSDPALVAGVAGAVVAAATDMVVHATPIGRGSALIAAAAGSVAAYALERGGLEAIENLLGHGPIAANPPFVPFEVEAIDVPLDPPVHIAEDLAAGSSLVSSVDNTPSVMDHLKDSLFWTHMSGTVIDPVEPGTPPIEGRDFLT